MGVDTNLTGVPQFDQLEIIKSGSYAADLTAIPINSSGTSTIAHNLGYVPHAIVYLTIPGSDGKIPMPYIAFSDATGLMIWQFSYTLDKTNLYVTFENHNNGLGSGYVYNYYLLRSRAITA